jgi:hypothetical protein
MLPEDMWKSILTHLAPQERMRACYRVSQKLSSATAATTEQLEISNCNTDSTTSFWKCLTNHGQYLTSLQACSIDGDWQQLPCANLRELNLQHCRIQLDPSDSHPGILQSCTGLTRLTLCRPTTLDLSTGLSAIAAMQDLQDLRLYWLESSSSSSEGRHDGIEYPNSLLLHLTKLTSLKLAPSAGQSLQAA